MKQLLCMVLLATHWHLFAFRDIKSTFYFDSDIDTLNQAQHQQLLDFVKNSVLNKQYKEIYIVGYTDGDGTRNYNTDLSMRRADFVSGMLLRAGLPEVLIDKNFKGEDNPVAANTTELNKSKNRRVEIILRLFDINTAADIVKELHGNVEQVFSLDNTKENSVEGKNGIRFIFPPYCFNAPAGKHFDSKNIKVVLTEVTNVQQGFFSNVLSESPQGLLESGGMFKINAFSDGSEIKMKGDMQYTVQINNKTVNNDMTVYMPLPSKDSLTRWENSNVSFRKVSTFKGDIPYLHLDEDRIKNWHIYSELDSFLKSYVLVLPVKPLSVAKPMRPHKPYEPKITSPVYRLSFLQRLFSTKAKRDKMVHDHFDKDYALYRQRFDRYTQKVTKYLSDSIEYPERLACYKEEFSIYTDSLYLVSKDIQKFRQAVYEHAFTKSFEYGKVSVLYNLQHKILRTYDVYSDIFQQCNKVARLNDFDIVYNQELSVFYKRMAEVYKRDFNKDFKLSGYYDYNNFSEFVFPYMYSTNLFAMMKADKELSAHISACVDTLVAEQAKLGIFNPDNFKVFYEASLSNFGWVNCDRFANYKKEDIFTLQIPNYTLKDKNIFAIVKGINSQVSIPLDVNGMHTVRLPKNKDIVIVAIGLDNSSTPLYAKAAINANKDMNLQLSFKAAKLSEIKNMISNI